MRSTRWDPDGTKAITGGADRTVRVWDLADGTPIASFTVDGWILALASSERTIVAGDTARGTHFLQLQGFPD